MAVQVGELYAKLGLESREFDQGLQQAGSSLEQTGGKFERLSSLASGALSTAGGVLAAQFVGAVGGAISGAASSVLTNAQAAQQNVLDLAASLGIPRAEAEALGDVATRVFGNNWGGSLEEAGLAVGEVARQLHGLPSGEMQQVTEKALALSDTFGAEVPESVNAANTLMQQFGLTSTQAFDFITKGYQSGLDNSGDFLDSIGEYSTQFSSGGATAEGFFNIMQSGLQGGMLGTDKAADAFKEFRVRIQDGSAATSASLGLLGIDSTKLAADMASGQVTAADAFQLVTTKLGEQTDQNVIMQAGVGLLGSQFEDLGTKGALALSMTGTSLESMAGATDGLNIKYTTLGAAWEAATRQMSVSLLPLGEILLNLANAALPYLIEGMTTVIGWITQGVTAIQSWVPTIQQVIAVISELSASAVPLFNLIGQALQGNEEYLIGFHEAITSILGEQVGGVVSDFVNNFVSLFSTIAPIIQQVIDTFDVLLASAVPILGLLADAVMGSGAAMVGFHETITAIFGEQLGEVIYAFVDTFVSRLAVLLSTGQQVFSSLQSIVGTVFGIISGFVQEHGAEIVATLTTAWNTINNVINVAISAVGSVIMTALGIIASFLDAHGAQIQAILSQAWSTIKTVIQAAIAVINGIIIPTLSGIAAFISAHSAQIMAVLNAAWTVIAATITGALNIIQGLIRAVMAAVQGDWSGAWAGIQQALSGAWTIIQGIVTGGMALVSSVVSLGMSALGALIAGVWSGIQTAVVSAWEGIKSAVINGVAAVTASAVVLGSNIINGIISGISSGIGALKAAVMGAAQGALDAAKSLLGIHSPSKVMADEVGKPISEGVAKGIEKKAPKVAKTLEETLADAVSKAAAAIKNGAEAFGLINELVLPAREKLAEFTQALGWTVDLFFTESQRTAKKLGAGTSLFAETAGKAAEAIGKAVDSFSEIADFVAPTEDQLKAVALTLRDAIAAFWHEAQLVLYALKDETAPEFAEVAGKAIDALGKAIGAFDGIEEFEIPTPEQLGNVAFALGEAVDAFWSIAQQHLEAINDTTAPQLADVASKVLDAMAKVISTFAGDELEGWIPPTREQLVAVATSMQEALDAFWDMTETQFETIEDENLPAFAEAVSKIVTAIGDSIQNFTGLSEYKGATSEVFEMIKKDISRAVTLMVEIAKNSDKEGVESAELFSVSVIKVFDAISGGIEALEKLRDYESVASVRMQAIAGDIFNATWWMAEIAKNADEEGVERAAAFSISVSEIFRLVKDGTEAIDSLRDYQALPKDRMASFLNDLMEALATLGTAALRADEFESVAETIATSMSNAANYMMQALEDFQRAMEYQSQIGSIPQAPGTPATPSTPNPNAPQPFPNIPGGYRPFANQNGLLASQQATAGSGIAGNSYNLHVYTQQGLNSVTAEFDMMRALTS